MDFNETLKPVQKSCAIYSNLYVISVIFSVYEVGDADTLAHQIKRDLRAIKIDMRSWVIADLFETEISRYSLYRLI